MQRVTQARVHVDDKLAGQCGTGLFVLVGAGQEDDEATADKLADRVAKLRVFNDAEGKMNLSLRDLPASGENELLVVSNFTLYGDVWKSRRPSFVRAASYDRGKELYDRFVWRLKEDGYRVATGLYGGDMRVELLNEGPVTMWIDTAER